MFIQLILSFIYQHTCCTQYSVPHFVYEQPVYRTHPHEISELTVKSRQSVKFLTSERIACVAAPTTQYFSVALCVEVMLC